MLTELYKIIFTLYVIIKLSDHLKIRESFVLALFFIFLKISMKIVKVCFILHKYVKFIIFPIYVLYVLIFLLKLKIFNLYVPNWNI